MPGPLIPLALGGLSFLGGMFGNRKKTATNTYSNTTSQTLNPQANALNQTLTNLIQSRLTAPTGLPAGYAEGGIRDINSVFDVIGRNRDANLTARGLSDSPVAAIGTDLQRGSEIARFKTGLPMVERDMRNQDMDFASRLFALQPRTTTQSGTGTNTQPGNMLGGGFGDLATMLGFLMGQGAFSPAKKG